MSCYRCNGLTPTGASWCPWCGVPLQEGERWVGEGERPDLECPFCGRGSLSSDPSPETPRLPQELEVQRQRFIQAVQQRQRNRSTATEVSLGGARARERILNLTREVGEENYFQLADGRVFKHVADLATSLDTVPLEVLRRHVSDFGNEFADWVLEVFQDPVLAGRMRDVTDPKYLQLEIYRYLSGRDPETTI